MTCFHVFALLCLLFSLQISLSIEKFNGEKNNQDNLISNEKNTRLKKLHDSKKFSKNKDFATLRARRQQSRLENEVKRLESVPMPKDFAPVNWSANHKGYYRTAIFAAAMSKELMKADAINFVGTARKCGFDGDIVMAIVPESREGFKDYLKIKNVVIYSVDSVCDKIGLSCTFYNLESKFSINMVRYYLYFWWSRLYSKETMILITDFGDVFFQSNPFTFKTHEWTGNNIQLTVFQEPHPNKVINRCIYNRLAIRGWDEYSDIDKMCGWITNCYGQEALQLIGHNTVSCSGASIGTRDAIVIYAYHMTQQIDPRVRHGANYSDDSLPQRACVSVGMDQGFHNWLIYSKFFDSYFNTRIFAHGEGPVNTVGGFYGSSQLLRFSLQQWGILSGDPPHAAIVNWDGSPSPVVHQLDRFLPTETFKSDYKGVLEAMNDLLPT